MLIAIALIAVVSGGLLMILGDHQSSGRLILAGIMLAFAAPFVDAAAGAFFRSLHEHGAVMAVLLVVLLVGAAAIKIRPHHGGSVGERPSLKRRVDHDN